MPDNRTSLPVDAVLDDLAQVLGASPCAILQAPPGSGKTTRVPLALLTAAWLGDKHILMLEPRRLAATGAARYMATLLGERIGATVGYTIRYDRQVSAATRIEVITEGLLTRRMQADPDLTDVGLVIFDEFHERSLHADLALALCRDIQLGLRPDLRILVMSATLDAGPVAALLGDCPIVTATGRSFPVTVRHLGDPDERSIAAATARGVRIALDKTGGDILAFLPGAGDIHRCRQLLGDRTDLRICPLFGALSFAEQQAAILPGDRRRVVLATNVAETSLTIEGIGAVVDSGWERRPRFDAARGMTSLETVRISQASAEQRAGRAGRLGPGLCLRLWSSGAHGALLPQAPPEIIQADLAPFAFELALWGITDPSALAWLDAPPAGHLAAAHRLLRELGALDNAGLPTVIGRKMAHYPAHPRIARLLAEAVAADCPGLGADLAALLDERDILADRSTQQMNGSECDLIDRLILLQRDRSERTAAVRRAAGYWRRRLAAPGVTAVEAGAVSRLLAAAFPDRLARRRSNDRGRYLLRHGHGARLSPRTRVTDTEWLVAVDLEKRDSADGLIHQASALAAIEVEALFGGEAVWQREVGWDDRETRLVVREVRRVGAIVLQERPAKPTPQDTVPALLALVRRKGLDLFDWRPQAVQLRARVRLLQRHLPEMGWPEWSDATLLATLDDWLAPWLASAKGKADLQRVDLHAALAAQLGHRRQKDLARLAPESLPVPSGSQIRLDYGQGEVPVLAVKLQELFGLAATPRVADGRVAVLIHLLSPAGRPLAVTGDLAGFWDTVYPEVKKEMKGRYPKHPWPDDPWTAPATRHTRSRRS